VTFTLSPSAMKPTIGSTLVTDLSTPCWLGGMLEPSKTFWNGAFCSIRRRFEPLVISLPPANPPWKRL
jgi:hypothetical protein